MIDELSSEGNATTLRRFCRADRNAFLEGWDSLSLRFFGEVPSEPAPFACVVVGTAVVGWVDYDDRRAWLGENEVNIGYGIFPEHRGGGHGTRAVELLCDFLVGRTPPLRATLLIDRRNAPSLALAARVGFRRAGEVDGQWWFKRPESRIT